MIVIIPCGARKRGSPAAAKELYTGPYYRACLRYARSLTSDDQIFILSGKYGLLALDDPVEPYEMSIHDAQAVTLPTLQQQVRRRRLSGPVVAVGGRRYTALCRALFADCQTPLDGVGGMGHQLRWMKQHYGRVV